MARVSTGASYETSKRRYVANLDGEKVVLLKSVEKTPENDIIAAEKYEQEKAVRSVEVDGDRAAIWRVLNHWIEWLATRPTNPVAPNTYERHARVVQSFTDLFGNLPARDIRVQHLEDWLARMQQPHVHPVNKKVVRWNQGSVKLALGTMRQAFKWACGRGLVTVNPFERKDAESLKTPSVFYQGKRNAVEEHEHEALLRLAVTRSNKDFAILLLLLHGTGARPSELIMAHAEEWNDAMKAFVIRADDPANKGRFKLLRLKKDRIIYIPDELVPFVKLLIEKYSVTPKPPSSQGLLITPLFRNKKGKPFTEPSVNARFASSREKVNRDAQREVIRTHVTPYGYRHAFVTRWLARMDSITKLAELLGTSVSMIEKHYSHLFKKHDILRESLNRFQAGESKLASFPNAKGHAG